MPSLTIIEAARNVWLLARPGRILLLGCLYGIGATIIALAQPLFARHILDEVIGGTKFVGSDRRIYILALAGASFGLIAIATILRYIANLHVERTCAIVLARLRRRMLRAMLQRRSHLSPEMRSGEVASRFLGDAQSASELVRSLVFQPAIDGLRLVAILVALMSVNWRLSLTVILVIGPMFGIMTFWFKRLRATQKVVEEQRASLGGHVVELFNGLRTVQTWQREKFEELRFARTSHPLLRMQVQARVRGGGAGIFGFFMGSAGTALLVCIGGLWIVSGKATTGDVVALGIYVGLIIEPVFNLTNSYSAIIQGMPALARCTEFTRDDSRTENDGRRLRAPCTSVVLTDVAFRYHGSSHDSLSALNAEVTGPRRIAVVGPSGAGKTTLVNIIGGFLSPTVGQVRINGSCISEYSYESLRAAVVHLPQEPFFFDGTIWDNLRYAKPSASVSELKEAMRRARLDKLIEASRFDAQVKIGERGVKLSAGERQLLSIARAFLSSPALLLLDEPTSNLDIESESYIHEALNGLLSDRISFTIAHSLGTVKNVDEIWFIENGSLVERGDHEQLVSSSNRYADFVKRAISAA